MCQAGGGSAAPGISYILPGRVRPMGVGDRLTGDGNDDKEG